MPEPRDWIDTLLSWSVQSLPFATRQHLSIERLGAGYYCIDGRDVHLRWAAAKPDDAPSLLVREAGVDHAEVQLDTYLAQAANVATSLGDRRSPHDARSQEKQHAMCPQLTFDDSAVDAEFEDAESQRMWAMRMACEQAEKRKLYESLSANSTVTGPSSRSLSNTSSRQMRM